MYLTTRLDQFDCVQLGLLYPRPPAGDWFFNSLVLCLADGNQRRELIDRCLRLHQSGLLQTALTHYDLQGKLELRDVERLDCINSLTEILRTALLNYANLVHCVCDKLGIKYVFLKGLLSSSVLYRCPNERPFKDIDLLVSRADGLRLFDYLKKLGFSTAKVDRETGRLVRTDCQLAGSDTGYEFPALWKLIPLECDPAHALNLATLTKSKIFIENGLCYVPVRVEIHFALSPQFSLPWTRSPNEGIIEHICYGLDWQSQLIYTIYKFYVDFFVTGKRFSGKLVCDALRIVDLYGRQLNWDEIAATAHEAGLTAPVRYFALHAQQTFGLSCSPEALGPLNNDLLQKGSLDFGDFLPQLFRTRKLFQFSGPDSV